MSSAERAVTTTINSYAADAVGYIEHTNSFERYPGLPELLTGFAGACEGWLVDAGCGSGRDSVYLESLDRDVIAVDRSTEMAAAALAGGVAAIVADVRSIPLPDASVGGVWASGVLQHLPDGAFRDAVAELGRCLRAGGLLAISVPLGLETGWRTSGPVSGPRWHSARDEGEVISTTVDALECTVEGSTVRTLPSGRVWLTTSFRV